jgi:hypothetical protein
VANQLIPMANAAYATHHHLIKNCNHTQKLP